MYASFDPETLKVLRRVLDEAAEALPQSERTHDRKLLLASRILALASKGETDPVRLRTAVLLRGLKLDPGRDEGGSPPD